MNDQPLDALWPGTRHRRAAKYHLKREAVLNAAAKLFCERGYDGGSLNDLADLLKVSKPTIYHYFASKDDILFEIKREGCARAIAFLQAAHDGPGSGLEKLRTVLELYAVLMTTYVGRCTADLPIAILDDEGKREVRALVSRADEYIHGILDQAVAEGDIATPDRLVAYHAIFGSLNWIPRWYRPGGRLTAMEVAKTQASILLDGLRVRARAPRPAKATLARSPG